MKLSRLLTEIHKYKGNVFTENGMGFRREHQVMEKYNKLFQANGLLLRVLKWDEDQIAFNIGYSLVGLKERQKFRCRCNSINILPLLDKIYQDSCAEARDLFVKNLTNKNASKTNKDYWDNLDAITKLHRIKHIQDIQSRVDRSKIMHGIPWNKGKTKYNDARLQLISEQRSGAGNPMFGARMSIADRHAKSILIKQRILDGLWTPHVHNSRTHWQCTYDGKKYRSSWEAIYASLNPRDEYETVRVEYEFSDATSTSTHVYIVDFVNHHTKVLTEIKPIIHTDGAKFDIKCKAAEQWCTINSYNFRVISQQYFVDNFSKIDFDKLSITNMRQKLARIKYEAEKSNRNN